jgi:hypothetical protein
VSFDCYYTAVLYCVVLVNWLIQDETPLHDDDESDIEPALWNRVPQDDAPHM